VPTPVEELKDLRAALEEGRFIWIAGPGGKPRKWQDAFCVLYDYAVELQEQLDVIGPLASRMAERVVRGRDGV